MIISFRCRNTEALYHFQDTKFFPPEIKRRALRKLKMLNNAFSLTDLRSPPGNHLEKIDNKEFGMYSIRINLQWRICFDWVENNAHNVQIIDYH